MSIQATNKRTVISRYFYLTQGILIIGWLIYLINFYTFYSDAYFYIDKRLSLFLRILSILNENWNQFSTYFIIAFLLMVSMFFLTVSLYFLNRKEEHSKTMIHAATFINIGLIVALFINICWPIFLILTILSASLIYIMLVFAKATDNGEEDESLEVVGPFITQAEAVLASKALLDKWKNIEKRNVTTEVYLNDDSKYYAEIYIELIEK